MTALRAMRRPGRPIAPGIAGAIGAAMASAVLAYAVSRQPVLLVVALVLAAVASAVVLNLVTAVGVLSGSFFFENYLVKGVGPITIAKGIGGLAVLAWAIEWTLRKRPLRLPAQLWPVYAFAAWIVASLTVVQDVPAAVIVVTRYVLFFVLFFIVVQAVGGSGRRADAVIDVTVVAAGISAAIGLVTFLSGVDDRARGPINDPNDFGFLLAAVVPLIIYRLRPGTPKLPRRLAAVALPIVFAGTLATFSRTALVGLAAAAAWGVVTRRFPLRWAVGGIMAMALCGLIAFELQPQTVSQALESKQHASGYNVETRIIAWRVAFEEVHGSPVFGVGVGNYASRFTEHEFPFFATGDTPTTHNAYLNVLAELGWPGLVLFCAYLLSAWLVLRRRTGEGQEDARASALAAGFVVAIVGSMFLTEQFYAPIWLLGAVATGLVRAPIVDPALDAVTIE